MSSIPSWKDMRRMSRRFFSGSFRNLCNSSRNDPFPDDVGKNTALIVDTNDFHGENLAGFSNYLHELGYDVIALIRHEVAAEDPFVLCEYKPRIVRRTAKSMKKFFKSGKHKAFSKILFASEENRWIKTEDMLAYLGCSYDDGRAMVVYHDVFHAYATIGKAKNDGRIFSICGKEFPMLNPHNFGNVPNSKKEGVTKLAVIGVISPQRRDYHVLFDSLEEMKVRGLDFMVYLIGEGKMEIPESLSSMVTLTGRLAFPQMFKMIVDSDFILTLLNPDVEAHRRYLTSATGALQLSLGFRKPLVINEEFAKAYRLSNDTAVLYSGTDVTSGMIRAVEMDDTAYRGIQGGIAELSRHIHEESLANLSRAVKVADK